MPHIHELIDFTVDAFIVYNKKVLLILHKKHNMWLAVGGHIELNEDPEAALFREVKEECGLEIEIIGEKPNIVANGITFLYAPAFLDIHDIIGNHKHISLRYFVRAKSDKVMLSEREHNDIRWFTEEDLDRPEFGINEATKFYATEALRRAG